MKNLFLSFVSFGLVLCAVQLSAQVSGSEAERIVPGSETVIAGKYSKVPEYVRFRFGEDIPYEKFEQWFNKNFNPPKGSGFKLLSKEADNIGLVHYRLQQTINGIPVEGTMYIVHTKDGWVESMNGEVLTDNDFMAPAHKIKEGKALSCALKQISAAQYKWQVPEAEKMLKETTGNPNATYYPKAEIVYLPENGDLKSNRVYMAYKFDIYAAKPLSRNYVFVDVSTGRVLKIVNRIENSNVTATAHTQYSGTRTITTDSYNGGYRLRESGRGNGIGTFNLQTSTNTGAAIDFVNSTTNWNNVDATLDQYATDAHLAAEATYDFYKNNFNRNSLNNSGLSLISYVHYDVSLENAFWDGQAMNYGDGYSGDGTHPLTSLEIGGHEITHGLTQYTANLNYLNESGALDESFSDCMGVSIRQSIKQSSSIDYYIGDEISGGSSAFRSMATPKYFGQPNTYMGQYWASGSGDFGGVHTNSGVQNYWYYLISHGGSGTNDNNQAYNITGLGISKAAAITFRNLTVYLTPNAQYSDARTYSIQAAIDLYGDCSPEVQTVTNAWYAVGVGGSFSASTHAGFNQTPATFCSPPATVYFTSNTSGVTSYQWYFGDGSGSISSHPVHTYSNYGDYTVKLYTSGACGVDSAIKTAVIHVNNNAPIATNKSICAGQSATLTAFSNSGTINWYNTATGGAPIGTGYTYTTPALGSPTTYYAEADIPAPVRTCGPASYNFGSGGYFINTNAHSIIFNCNSPQNLVSVDVYAETAGNRTITLTDSAGNVLQSGIFYIANGLNTVALGFPLPVVANLRLSISGNTYLYRNQTGAAYPYYSSDSTIILTNTDAGTDYYYYFYNWKLQADPCASARTPVAVNIINGQSSFSYNINSTTASFTPSASGLNSYQWNFGDGNSSTDQNPSHTYSNSGSYTVTLIQSNGSCGDTVVQTILITTSGISQVSSIESFNIFPNPTGNTLNINISTAHADDWNLLINNMVGQTVLARNVHLNSGDNSLAIDVSAYAAGVYIISFKNDNVKEEKRFVKSS